MTIIIIIIVIIIIIIIVIVIVIIIMMMITGSSWWCHCERGCRMTRGKRNTYMTQHMMLGATRIIASDQPPPHPAAAPAVQAHLFR
jgi:hypothetical protein